MLNTSRADFLAQVKEHNKLVEKAANNWQNTLMQSKGMWSDNDAEAAVRKYDIYIAGLKAKELFGAEILASLKKLRSHAASKDTDRVKRAQGIYIKIVNLFK